MNNKKDNSRREFIKKSGIVSIGSLLGAPIVFGHLIPKEISLLGFTETPFEIDGKHPDLILLNDRPINAEVPPHLLDDEVTPNNLLFIRNNGIPPSNIKVEEWTLKISGESVEKQITYSIQELKSKFKHYSYQLTLECGGNGRSEFNPPAKGNQWGLGAVSSAIWTGVRLKDILNEVGVKSDAIYIGYYGKDIHLTGDPEKTVISRGVPIDKAMEDETLIAWEVNGEPIPEMNGFPLRLVIGGWPASVSGKWLSEIKVRNKIHDGPKMGGQSYRIPCEKVAPGEQVNDENMCIIESMPVKSLITYPKTGAMITKDKSLQLRGKAWAGDHKVSKMEVSIDFGATWQEVSIKPPANRLAWQIWEGSIHFPKTGYYEVWAKATDENGISQPMIVPGWNPKGYLNNACHRIAIKVK